MRSKQQPRPSYRRSNNDENDEQVETKDSPSNDNMDVSTESHTIGQNTTSADKLQDTAVKPNEGSKDINAALLTTRDKDSKHQSSSSSPLTRELISTTIGASSLSSSSLSSSSASSSSSLPLSATVIAPLPQTQSPSPPISLLSQLTPATPPNTTPTEPMHLLTKSSSPKLVALDVPKTQNIIKQLEKTVSLANQPLSVDYHPLPLSPLPLPSSKLRHQTWHSHQSTDPTKQLKSSQATTLMSTVASNKTNVISGNGTGEKDDSIIDNNSNSNCNRVSEIYSNSTKTTKTTTKTTSNMIDLSNDNMVSKTKNKNRNQNNDCEMSTVRRSLRNTISPQNNTIHQNPNAER